jgi:glycosyltransferase involved in cell wall biosynthesis
LYKKAKKLHSQSAFDMVHTRPGIPALVGLKMKTRFGIKFLNDIREFYADSRADGHIWNLENFFYKKIYRFFKQQESAAVTKSDGIVCLTYAAEKIIKSWPEYKLSIPLQVIPCSVDLNLFNPFHFDEEFKKRLRADLHIKENEFIVSYLGSVGSWYLIDEMIRFFKIISDHNKNAKFLFISPNAKAQILRLADKFNLDEKKIIVKEATRKEVPALLSLSKFAVFFIKPCYSKQSSSPTKHGEIMAMGIPVITNQGVGDVEEIVTKYDSGVVLKELNDNEFHKAAAFISSESFSDTNCIRHAAKEFYDLKSATEKYKTIYDKICTSSSNQIE